MKKPKLNMAKLQSLDEDLFREKDKLSNGQMRSVLGGSFQPTYHSIWCYDETGKKMDTGVHNDAPPPPQYA